MGPGSRKSVFEVFCQQVLMPDASVYSVQWLELPAEVARDLDAHLLLERYLQFIRQWTRTLIRPQRTEEGVEFRVLSTSFALLSFSPARYFSREGAEEASLSICGGFLVQSGECDRGMFSVSKLSSPQGVRIAVQLSDYCPLILGSATPSRLRRLLYRLTQAYIHKVVTVKFLSRLYGDLTGSNCRPVVKKVQVRQGTET